MVLLLMIRSDAPQEEIERDMICDVMQMNRGTKTITLHSNQQQGERIAKTKIQQKCLSYIKTDQEQRGKERGVLRTSAAQCLVHCSAILVIVFFSLAYCCSQHFATRPIHVYWLTGKMLATTKVCFPQGFYPYRHFLCLQHYQVFSVRTRFGGMPQ